MRNIDWKRLGLAVLCSIVIMSGLLAFAYYFRTLCIVLAAVIMAACFVFVFYTMFGDVEEKDDWYGEDKD